MLPIPTVLVVMGVAGSGKTTVGRALAVRLGWRFEDADTWHSGSARAKMASGEGLTDADREPWLDALATVVRQRAQARSPTVLACSSLTAGHRQRLRQERQDVAFVWLDVPPDTLALRLAARTGHIAGPALLSSQLQAFEVPGDALRVDGTRPVDALVQEIAGRLAPG